MTGIATTPEWAALQKDADALKDVSVRALFEDDPGRFERYSVEAAGLFLDYSKNKITEDVDDHLISLAMAAGLEGAREAMFAGEEINVTEGRAVLHPALRDFSMRDYHVGGENVSQKVRVERDKMKSFADAVHRGGRLGYTGKPLTTVVNIGIGGSDLGPLMVTEALRPYWIEGRRAFFVSNVDGQHIADTLGLSLVHTNKTIRKLADRKFLKWRAERDGGVLRHPTKIPEFGNLSNHPSAKKNRPEARGFQPVFVTSRDEPATPAANC